MNTQKHHPHTLKILTVLMGAIVIVPTMTHSLLGDVRNSGVYQSQAGLDALKPWISSNRAEYRQLRRAFTDAINDCEYRNTALGEDIECPNINDPQSFTEFMEQEQVKKVQDTVATRKQKRENSLAKAAAAMQSLTQREQQLIRRFQNMGGCPLNIKGKDIYEKCQTALGETRESSIITGFLNSKTMLNLNNAPKALTLKDRLRIQQESLHGAAMPRQQDIVRPTTRSVRQ